MRELCDRYGILLICDEVMSGFGRTGAWFAVDHWKVKPDLMTMAKGLTSAYAPLGAVAMTPAVAATFDHRVYQGGLTFNGHPISMAAAIANIEVMRDLHLPERSKEMGKSLALRLRELGESHPSVGDVRSIGLFAAVELVRDRKTREPMAPFDGTSPEMIALRRFLLERGLYVYIHWNNVLIAPPLIISEDELAEGLAILDEGLRLTDRRSALIAVRLDPARWPHSVRPGVVVWSKRGRRSRPPCSKKTLPLSAPQLLLAEEGSAEMGGQGGRREARSRGRLVRRMALPLGTSNRPFPCGRHDLSPIARLPHGC